MKLLYIIITTYLLTVSNSALAKTACGEHDRLLEKEMLELTYMEEDELKEDYCTSQSYILKNIELITAAISAFDTESMTARTEEMQSCSLYSEKVIRVLKKDHNVEVVECSED